MLLFQLIAAASLIGPPGAGELEVEIVSPEGVEGPRPVLLALPPGRQDAAAVQAGLDRYWRSEALKRGWTVVSPAAGEGEPLGVEALLAVIRSIEETHRPEGGRVHLAGVSKGSLAAFELALAAPDRLASLSLLSGRPGGTSPEALERLAALPIALYVGGDDAPARGPMEALAKALTSLGSPPARVELFEGEGRTPESLSPAMLFDTLETFRVHAALTDFHDAAAKADGARYFGHFAPDAVFIGTDATERWTLPEFRAFAEPYFDAGRGWTYVGRDRQVFLGPGGQTAWFDEMLDNESYGETRGTGVFVRVDGGWRLAQYHLTIPVPNELAKELVRMIRER